MKIFEIDAGKFINFDNVFNFEIITTEDRDEVFWRFYTNADSFVNSKKFSSKSDAQDWLDITLTRASSAQEIIRL